MAGQKWMKSRFPGVRYYVHPQGRVINPNAPKVRQKVDCYFSIRYKRQGKSLEEGLGWTSQGWNEEEAANLLAELKRNYKEGKRPQTLAEKRQMENDRREEEAQKSMTVEDLADAYIEKWAKPNKKSWEEDQKNLEKNVLPVIGSMRVVDVSRRDINEKVLDPIQERGAPVQANRVLALMRKMFNWAVEKGHLDETPASHIKGYKERSRDRVLSEEEIKDLLQCIQDSDLHKITKLALEMILRTGQRPGEIREIEKQDIDRKKALWLLPSSKAKNGIAHSVPLPAKVMELIDIAWDLAPDSTFLFPSPVNGQEGPLSEYGLAQGLRRCIRRAKIEQVTPHDLRRTAATRISELGFNRLVVDKILNHKDQTVGGVYDRHKYDKEKMQALEAWEKRLAEILGVPKTPEEEAEEIKTMIEDHKAQIKELRKRLKDLEEKAHHSNGKVLSLKSA